MPGVEAATTAGTAVAEHAPVFSWGNYAQAVGLMFLLVFVLWAILWLLRRSGRCTFLPRPGRNSENLLKVEAQLPLGPHRGLMVVRFHDKHVLLGMSGESITALSESYVNSADDEDFSHILRRSSENAQSRTAAADMRGDTDRAVV